MISNSMHCAWTHSYLSFWSVKKFSDKKDSPNMNWIYSKMKDWISSYIVRREGFVRDFRQMCDINMNDHFLAKYITIYWKRKREKGKIVYHHVHNSAWKKSLPAVKVFSMNFLLMHMPYSNQGHGFWTKMYRFSKKGKIDTLQYIHLNWTPPISSITGEILIVDQRSL